jgi:hypothetical protein
MNPGDNCPWFANPLQVDANADGRGNACECGDANGNGIITVADTVAAIQQVRVPVPFCNPGVLDPCSLCDANSSNTCTVADLLGIITEIRERWHTSSCARQPYPGP